MSSRQSIILSFVLLLVVLPLRAQQIRFNEVVSSNSIHFDEDGDSPDWFELHNYGNESLSLAGWTVSDKADQPEKWTFPNISIAANSYLLLWASDKDRKSFGLPQTLISEGDEFRYITPTQAVSTQWTSLDFDDTSWDQGKTGFGYGDGTTPPL